MVLGDGRSYSRLGALEMVNEQVRDDMSTLQYGVATVATQGAGDLVIARVQGVITPEVAERIVRDSSRWSADDPVAAVVSYQEAALQMSPDTLFAAVRRALPTDRPTAFVVQPDQMDLFAEYVKLHAQVGVLKVAFTSAEQAQRWAAEQARVRGYWARLARAVQASP